MQQQTRVYVLYGQGGIWTSYGMYLLSQQLAKVSQKLIISTHNWKDYQSVIDDIKKLPVGIKIVLIGYSLGGNAITWIADAIKVNIDLMVAYDPTILTKLITPGPHVKRCLLYHNTSFDAVGHGQFSGPHVEHTETSMMHLAVCYSQALHNKTIAAVKKVIG